eukprot:TRINITY_DN13567_c0_g1_i1.p1 TRINITY_DN13567_c0_g1~~TRINITY_DN13567_c0_g1_i1.p1  ORF type:complete len:188 (-),score=45.61 TRINITY_DN13567_c0_g1_i1:342-905(-)
MPFCTQCGTALGDAARFCSNCGAPVLVATTASSLPASSASAPAASETREPSSLSESEGLRSRGPVTARATCVEAAKSSGARDAVAARAGAAVAGGRRDRIAEALGSLGCVDDGKLELTACGQLVRTLLVLVIFVALNELVQRYILAPPAPLRPSAEQLRFQALQAAQQYAARGGGMGTGAGAGNWPP